MADRHSRAFVESEVSRCCCIDTAAAALLVARDARRYFATTGRRFAVRAKTVRLGVQLALVLAEGSVIGGEVPTPLMGWVVGRAIFVTGPCGAPSSGKSACIAAASNAAGASLEVHA